MSVLKTLQAQWKTLRRNHSRTHSVGVLSAALIGLVLLSERTSMQGLQARFWFPHVARQRWSLLDPLRIVIQVVWLVFANRAPRQKTDNQGFTALKLSAYQARHARPVRLLQRLTTSSFSALTALAPKLLGSTLMRVALTVVSALFVAFTISLPMDASAQALMLLAFWAVALWVRDTSGRLPLLLMIVLSVLVSSRYLWWRVTQTINWDVPLDATFAIILLSAEIYAWTILILGYIQTAWPLKRGVAKLPDDLTEWPSVDIFIPSYNEPLKVVRPTILAALAIDWPKDKLNVYVLDDGKRDEFRQFCDEAGVDYMVRPDNSHAKAGNLNHALGKTGGDYIAIFDCDHIPTRSFLQMTMGWFLKDPKLALVQTPHHFFSPDPFERNLSIFRSKPNENELFYGLIQDGNDLWNSSFFCGSCAVLKRGPLEEIGGIATETVTEDAHTALKLHRLGYNSAYLNIPQAAGLATESLSSHIGQRIRWARGMAQIFRLDNPLFGKGLNLGQRLCYANAMLYFFNGIPRMIFMLAPLAFLLFGAYIIFAPAVMIAAYALPHIVHSYLTNSRHQGPYRHSFWAEMYETVLAWYILRPTTVALFAPKQGKFNVTEKGGLNESEFYDWKISSPYLILISLSLIGAAFGIWRLINGPADEYLSIALNLVWLTYNLIILGGAISVAEEAKQVRVSHRISVNRPATLITDSGHSYQVTLDDFSDNGAGLSVPDGVTIKPGSQVQVALISAETENAFNADVVSVRKNKVGVQFRFASLAQEQSFITATFSRADAWTDWRPEQKDSPVTSFGEVITISLEGYKRLVNQFTPILNPVISVIIRFWAKCKSVLPRTPGKKVSDNG
ncbi:UDP-forming cellulose synthase catalytic subunit [Aliidiomarina sedimenti]|uniref:Cellulose synthase catalytic subunit [UDP-forming] n=1 Tax=Aliidiomarina sedimenti TaxID=1933879 RepID=A0ABY0C2B5_9GAMM|nr:UDP-forming cellulose synthase catalytic subunit [Aliidiomarina sedimenti]RUO31630.1 UDP-forming cellulose synthase catalytic subunit [Aliidiomarina sedimenti]